MNYQYKLLTLTPDVMVVLRYNKRRGTKIEYLALEKSNPEAFPDMQMDNNWHDVATLTDGDTAREIMNILLMETR